MRLLSERGAVNPEGLRCFSGQCRTEHPNDEWRIWLEDIQETPKTWTVERHGIAARHLGQFTGPTSRGVLSRQNNRGCIEDEHASGFSSLPRCSRDFSTMMSGRSTARNRNQAPFCGIKPIHRRTIK